MLLYLLLFRKWLEQRDKINKDIALKKQDYDLQLKAQENIAKDRYLLSQLETFAEIRPIVFQQQQLQKTLQQLAPQIQQKHHEFSTLTTQFEQQKTLYTQVETTLNQFQDFEQKHQNELTQVRKFVQERDYIAEEYKKTKIRLTQLKVNSNHLSSNNNS